MIRFKCGFFFLLLVPSFIGAQSGIYPFYDAQRMGTGQAAVARTGPAAVFVNPAGLSEVAGFSVLAAAENRFVLSELQSFGLGAVVPLSTGVLGLQLGRFGEEAYNELMGSLSYSLQLSPGFSLGAQFIYHQTSIPEYGTSHRFTFSVGVRSRLTEGLYLAAHVYNPIRQEITADENLPTIFQAGLAYRPSPQLWLLADVEKDINYPVRFRGGMEYQLTNSFFLRTGIATAPALFTFGAGVKISSTVQLDIAAARHQYLGFMPAVTVSYSRIKGATEAQPAGNPNLF